MGTPTVLRLSKMSVFGVRRCHLLRLRDTLNPEIKRFVWADCKTNWCALLLPVVSTDLEYLASTDRYAGNDPAAYCSEILAAT
jgi:hypothetical protein